ncbi:MAG: DNA-binding protein [Microbacterium sp.]|nr:MAG: DNA-binding protein [Microbacterium sp.]
MPEIATRQEVAAYLKLSVPTLARWAGEGRGPKFVKFGGACRYLRADVLEYVAHASATS